MGRAIMVQGTSSHAGKTFLAASLCRALSRRGMRVAPFKAQNMSNNSYVTAEGGEIGWAQAVQAEAAGREPSTKMNPLLLKPTMGRGFQVVRFGRSIGHFTSRRYARRLPVLFREVAAAAADLRRRNDVVVIEGMGSPVEVNVKRHDIANMRLALRLAAPVIVVGDIDLGGVFAQLVGTFELLTPRERKLVRGFVINKMSGDAAVLRPGIRMLERRTRVPVLGVLPYVRDLGFPEEDQPPPPRRGARKARGKLKVEVVRLPGISNFMDVDGLGGEPDVDLSFIDAPRRGTPDVLILPGSKNTIAALRHMRRRGLDGYVRAAAAAGRHVVGICGGYQMMGREVRDPKAAESTVKRERGLGLLPVTTVFSARKVTSRARAVHRASGLAVDGYEIHMGRTSRSGGRPVFALESGGGRRDEGCAARGGRVWGTHLHGLFDAAPFRRWFLNGARRDRGMPAHGAEGEEERARRERVYERAADLVEKHLNMSAILAMAGRGPR